MRTKKPLILAVDDTPGNLVALEAVLEKDYDLLLARSGAEAIEILKQHPNVTVVLMDIQMPVMDGYETASRIKLLPGCADLPIVFITAVYHEDPHVKRGYKAGAVDYFTKPFDPELLRLKMAIYTSFREKAAVLREREDQLRETEELLKAGRKLSAVLESLPVGVLIADGEGRICQTNDEVSRICGGAQTIDHNAYGDLLGWWSSGGEQLRVPQGPLALALTAGQSSHSHKLQIRCFDGSPRSVLASASPLFGVGNKVVGAVIMLRDMTQSQQIELELESRVARLVSLGVELEQTVQRRS